MIFSRTHKQVLSRDKTQTRRLKKPGDELRRTDDGIPYIYNTISKRIRYCAGRDYAVQPGRSKHSLGKIRITDIRMEKLLHMSLEDAMAEGILPDGTTRPDLPTEYLRGFIETWDRLYLGTPNEWTKNPEVIVLEFELIEIYDADMKRNLTPPLDDLRCLHGEGIRNYSTGGMHFSEGEPWDDICQHGVCAICGEHIDCESCCSKMAQPQEEEVPF